jgi:hypothetical protein
VASWTTTATAFATLRYDAIQLRCSPVLIFTTQHRPVKSTTSPLRLRWQAHFSTHVMCSNAWMNFRIHGNGIGIRNERIRTLLRSRRMLFDLNDESKSRTEDVLRVHHVMRLRTYVCLLLPSVMRICLIALLGL